MTLTEESIKPIYTRVAMVLLGGFKFNRAAEILGLHPNTLYRLWANPSFREYYRTLEKERNSIAVENTAIVEKIFQDHSEKAALALVEMLDSTSDPSRKKSICDDILDRAGFAPKQRLDVNTGKPMRIVIEEQKEELLPLSGDPIITREEFETLFSSPKEENLDEEELIDFLNSSDCVNLINENQTGI